jgi:hypothetical protein
MILNRIRLFLNYFFLDFEFKNEKRVFNIKESPHSIKKRILYNNNQCFHVQYTKFG